MRPHTIPAVSDELHDADDVRVWAAEHVYRPSVDAPVVGRVGLETELFPFWLAPDGRPAARLALVEVIGIVDGIPGAVRNPDAAGRPSWQLDGALITEEPGAQVEVAGPPEADAAAAISGTERVIRTLSTAFEAAGAGLAAAGLDCWSPANEVPVQLEIPRYSAMTTYFGRRGASQGHLLMCASCSIQINVDLGPPGTAVRRWLLANLAAPVLTAAFAASPVDAAVNGRALGWRGLDPSRTGVAPPLVEGDDEPINHVVADALRADVLLIERNGHTHAGHPGWTFADWLAEPHPDFGRPTAADLAGHLTTLFPEARLRGFLEVRTVDSLPARWRGAAVALVVALLYDDTATSQALAVLEPQRAALPQLLERAAQAGLADPLLRRLSEEVLDAALDGSRRLGIPSADEAAEFLDRYTHRGRHPSDELRTARAHGPAAAFTWARS